MSLPITPLRSISNRSGRRPYIRQATEILYNLEQINRNFLLDLFGKNDLSYQEIYNFYRREWLRACHDMKSWGKGVVAVDKNWFESEYRPRV